MAQREKNVQDEKVRKIFREIKPIFNNKHCGKYRSLLSPFFSPQKLRQINLHSTKLISRNIFQVRVLFQLFDKFP